MSVNRDTFNQVMVPNYNPQQVIPVRGEGSRLWDQQGKDYIDLAAGIAVNALGHGHPELVATLKSQADKLWHLSNIFTNEPALELAQKLTAVTFADRVYFCNSGAEANEAAFKLVRKYAYDNFGGGQAGFEKHEIIAFNQSFHGRTLFTVTVGGQPKYREGFEPVPAGISHVPYNDLDALKAAISDKTCAVVLEPILGEGGIIPGDPDFIKGVRALCDQHNALMVLDEIQTGMGRTGKLFAYERLGIAPDILTSAKALGCGFPIGAMLCTDKVAQSFQFGTHGSTYGGNPLGCAVASKALDIINQPQLLADVYKKHEQFVAELNAINDEFNVFSEIRGQGLLIGAVLNDTWKGKAGSFLPHSIAAGVMHLIAGPDVLRFAPSLIITDEEIAESMRRLKKAIAATVAAK